MLKIGVKNRIIFDSENYATGKILDIKYLPERETRNGFTLKECLEFVFEIDCTKENQTRIVEVAPSLSPKQIWYESLNRHSYNLITTICLQLNLVKIEDLENDDFEIDLVDLIGKNFKFKMKKSAKNPNLTDIDYSTLEFLNSKVSKNSKLSTSSVE